MQVYAIQRGGELRQYPQVLFEGSEESKDLPSHGILSNPNDKPLVTEIQDKMIDTYGHAIVENICGKAKEGKMVGLNAKLLRPQHVGSLMAAVEKHQVAELDLGVNQLGPEGGAKLAEALQTNTSLTRLECALAALGTDAQRSLPCGRATRVSRPPLLRAQRCVQRARRLRPAGPPRGRRQPRRAPVHLDPVMSPLRRWGDRGEDGPRPVSQRKRSIL